MIQFQTDICMGMASPLCEFEGVVAGCASLQSSCRTDYMDMASPLRTVGTMPEHTVLKNHGCDVKFYPNRDNEMPRIRYRRTES
jgi:hypothetical protein